MKSKETETPAPKKSQKPTKAKVAIDRDTYGNRTGSQAARINAVITRKPKTFEAIADESKLGLARIRAHVKWLVDKQHAEVTDAGVALK